LRLSPKRKKGNKKKKGGKSDYNGNEDPILSVTPGINGEEETVP
jgi:hypothetical protein